MVDINDPMMVDINDTINCWTKSIQRRSYPLNTFGSRRDCSMPMALEHKITAT